MAKVALLICLVAAMAASALSTESSCSCYYTCPPGWTRFQNSCYKFNGVLNTHPGAEQSCNQRYSYYNAFTGFTIGGEAHLTSINSEEEQNFIFDLWRDSLIWPHTLAEGSINVNTQNAQWIGAQKVRNEWTWTDETPGPEPTSDLIYNKWGPGQPDGDGVCGHMWHDSGIWNDYLCSNPVALLPFTCEMPVIKRCE